MSHVTHTVSHGTRMHESCHTHEMESAAPTCNGISHVTHTMSLGTHMHESCHTPEMERAVPTCNWCASYHMHSESWHTRAKVISHAVSRDGDADVQSF